jgi:hypothetical protein
LADDDSFVSLFLVYRMVHAISNTQKTDTKIVSKIDNGHIKDDLSKFVRAEIYFLT